MLQSAGTERHLLKSVKEKKMTYFRHIMRKKYKCLEAREKKMQGTTPGARPRGRPKTRYQALDGAGNGRTVEAGLD